MADWSIDIKIGPDLRPRRLRFGAVARRMHRLYLKIYNRCDLISAVCIALCIGAIILLVILGMQV